MLFTRYCAGPAYYRMCSTDVYCSKQTGSSSTKGNHHPSFLRFWNWAEENCRCSQNLWRRRKCCWSETQQTFVNGLLGFIALGIYTPRERVCIAHNNCMSCPSIWATLSALLINILLGSFQLFCQWSASLWGWNNPVQRCLPVGGGCIIPAGGVVASRTDWQTALMCNRRRPAATSSRRASFPALASANSFVYFASSAATSRWRICMSVIAAFALQFLWHFCRAGLCR